MEVIENYQPMIAKYWKKCSSNGSFTFEEMVNEVYIRAKQSNVTMDRGIKQVTTYMAKICYTLSTAVLKFNSHEAKILGVDLGGCRGKSMETFKKKVLKLEDPARRTGNSNIRTTIASSGISKKKSRDSHTEDCSPVFGGKSQGHIAEDLELMMDVKDKLTPVEQEVVRLIISGCSVSEVARRLEMHPWSLRTSCLPRIGQKLQLGRD